MLRRVVMAAFVVSSYSTAIRAGSKSVLLWTGSPFGFWGGPFNQSKLDEAMDELHKLSDVVDTVSVPAYFLGDPSNSTLLNETGGLVPAGVCRDFMRYHPI